MIQQAEDAALLWGKACTQVKLSTGGCLNVANAAGENAT